MAAAASLPLVSLEEYLRSSYEPDVDYVDGVLEERNMGEFDHADLQSEVSALLRNHAADWGIRAVVETRVQVAPGRYRVPDICVLPLTWKREPIVRDAPMLCIEVLSPEDRMSRVLRRCRDFFTLGVPEIWILDPQERRAYRVLPDGSLHEMRDTLALSGTEVIVELAAVFAVLDR